MNTNTTDRMPRITSGGLVKVAAVAAASAMLAHWLIVVTCCSIGWDAGYYACLAREVCRGRVPGLDLPTPYSPGIFYLLGILGETGLRSPVLLKTHVVVCHLLNTWLCFLILRRLKHPPWMSLFWAVIYSLWVLSCEGRYLVLEPYQCLFGLLAVFALLALPGLRGAVLAGIAAGCSLMMKQYSIVWIPGLFIMVLAAGSGRTFGKVAGGARAGARNLIAFLLLLPVPWLVYCLATSTSPVESFLHLSTYGYGAGEYGVMGPKGLFHAVCRAGANSTVLLGALVCAVTLLYLRPSLLNWAIVLLLFCSLIPLYVRAFPHYVQLAAPWGVLAMAQLTEALTDRRAPFQGSGSVYSLLLAIPLLPIMGDEMATSIRLLRSVPIRDQERIASAVGHLVPRADRVVVVPSGPATFVHLLADKTPPGMRFGFVAPKKSIQLLECLGEEVEAVVLVEGAGLVPEGFSETVTQWLVGRGWTAHPAAASGRYTVTVFDRGGKLTRERKAFPANAP